MIFRLNTSYSPNLKILSNTVLIIFIFYFYSPLISLEIKEVHDEIGYLEGLNIFCQNLEKGK